MAWLVFVAGIFVGTFFGFLLASLCASRRLQERDATSEYWKRRALDGEKYGDGK